jgi:hypothetical protein
MFKPPYFRRDFNTLDPKERARVQVDVEGDLKDTFYFFNQGISPIGGLHLQGWPYKQPDVVIETRSKKTVHLLKYFGLARGNTPVSQMIAGLGDYVRKVMQTTTYSGLSEVTKEKVKAVRQAQDRLAKLEAKECALLPGDGRGQESLREEILQILDELGTENHKLSYSFFHSDGRLGRRIDNLRYQVETMRFPANQISRADQIQPADIHSDQPYFYRMSDHHFQPHETISFLQALYHHRRKEPMPSTQSPLARTRKKALQLFGLQRLGFTINEHRNADLKALYQENLKFKSSLPTRLIGGIGKFLLGFPTSVMLGIADGFNFFRQEMKDYALCHRQGDISKSDRQRLKKIFEKLSSTSTTEKDKSKKDTIDPPYHEIKPKNSPEILDHDNIFSNILQPAKSIFEGNQEFVLQNPTIYAAFVGLGIAPAISVLIPFDVIAVMKFSGTTAFAHSPVFAQAALIGSHASAGANIYAYKHRSSSRVLNALDKISHQIQKAGTSGIMSRTIANGGLINQLEILSTELEDPFIFADLVLTISMAGIATAKLTPSTVQGNKQLRAAILKESVLMKGYKAYPEVRKLIHSAIRFPLHFITTPIRLLGGVGDAIRKGSLDPLRFELGEAARKIVYSTYASMSFLNGLSKFAWRTLNVIPKLLNELLLTVPSRIIGTAGDLLHSIGKAGRRWHKKIEKRSTTLSGLAYLPLRIPSAILQGIGWVGIQTAKFLKRTKNRFRLSWDRTIFRPINALLSRNGNTIDRIFNPNHPANRAAEQIKSYQTIIDELKTSGNSDPGVMAVLKKLQDCLAVFRDTIKKHNTYQNPQLSKTLKKGMLSALQQCRKESVEQLFSACKGKPEEELLKGAFADLRSAFSSKGDEIESIRTDETPYLSTCNDVCNQLLQADEKEKGFEAKNAPPPFFTK